MTENRSTPASAPGALRLQCEPASLPEDALRFRADLARRLAVHDMAWGEPSGPPVSWKEGAPLGNGDFGALVYGHPDNLCFALGKTDLWDRSGSGRSGFPAGTFDDFRRTYIERDEPAFQRMSQEPPDYHEQHATTAGMFRLHLLDANAVMSPTLRVSLWEGMAHLTSQAALYRQPNRDLAASVLASRAYRVLSLRVALTHANLGTVAWELSREPHPPHPAPLVQAGDGIAWLQQTFTTGDTVVVAVAASGQPLAAHTVDGRLAGALAAGGSASVEMHLTVVTSRDAADPVAEARARLTRAKAAGFEAIAREHRAWWADYWRRAYVCLDDAPLEKWWYTSLYLCASTIEPGCQSPGLQGVWIKENVPAWFGDYHSNVNLQAVYWGLYAANRVEYLEPFVRLLHDMAPRCRQDTRDYFQMRGLRFPHAGGIDGRELTTGNYSLLGVSVGGSGWLAQLLWQVYDYTGDRAYLRDQAYPLLKEVALFYEDYLSRGTAAGRCVLEPSVHFEALLPGFAGWGRNSLYELTMVRVAFGCALAAAEALGADPEDRTRWQSVLAQLPDFPTDPERRIWIGFEGRDVREHGSHQFSLAPVFPGELVSLWHGDGPWRERALATLADPLTTRRTGTGHAWCGGQGIREIIRLGRADEAATAARWQPGEHTNGLTHSWSSFFLQADHGPGMCSVLSDMLLLAPGGVLRVFPCFPASIPAAFHSLRGPGAFLVSAEKRGERIDYVILQSLAGNALRIANPWPGERARLRDLETRELRLVSEAEVLTLPTIAGQRLILDCETRPYETVPVRQAQS